jgi:hypothetical protein
MSSRQGSCGWWELDLISQITASISWVPANDSWSGLMNGVGAFVRFEVALVCFVLASLFCERV